MLPVLVRRAALAAAIALGLGLSSAAQQQPTFKSGARTVAVYATVTDEDGRLVTVWPEEFTTLRAKWIPLPAWGQRK